jgi:hypothetical protein
LAFSNELKNDGVESQLFDKFNALLSAKGLNAKGGHIIDAAFSSETKLVSMNL